MNILENMKPWYMLADKDEHFDFADGQFAVTSEEIDGLTVVSVRAALPQGRLHADCAAAITIPTLGEVEGWFANFQNCDHWCKPKFGKELSEIPNRTQALLWKKPCGCYGFILPLVDKIYKTAIRGAEGGMEFYLYSNVSDLSEIDTHAFICGEGSDPYKLMNDCARLAVKVLQSGGKVRADRRYNELFEYLGWCSWDAMEIRVSTEGLLEKCEELKAKNIPVKWAIIDDMWAECDQLRDIPDTLTRATGMFGVMHSSKLRSFEADPKRFPKGLADCISRMKEYGLKVGMWHPINGYWAAIDPDSELAEKYKDLLIKTPNGRLMPRMEQDKIFMFYHAFHTFLAECGTDFVKIDNQGGVYNGYRNVYPVGQAARAMQNAISASVGAHFDNNIINCMGMASENMFNRPQGAISRCSGDFQPENRAWFIRHLLACAYNSLVQGMFFWSDWDMWWSDDEQALKNSVLRAISGGPIYVSDKIGRSRPEIFRPLCYSDGRILRCADPAIPTEESLVCDPETSKKIFKVKNTYDVGGVVAAYNLDSEESPVTGTISAADIGADYDEYVIYEHFSGEVTVLKRGEVLEVTLKDHDDFRLYNIVPVTDGMAVLGLIDKFNAPMAAKHEFGGVYSLYEGGRFAFVCTDGKTRTVTTESGVYQPVADGKLCTVELPLTDRHAEIK
ncbi:MAG: hypothetical protein E7632_09255 [Ruminococcaceae bacterium]|nr:hypothetical protein [Oscillospiraceae bacterium]